MMRFMMPHAVLFLGDLMDGGNRHADAEYTRSLLRLERVLAPPPSSAVLHVAGNHDTGDCLTSSLCTPRRAAL
jgi:hypothetical protein